jgi:hypothetical protein
MVYRKYHIAIAIGNNFYYKETKAIRLPKVALPYIIGYLISIPTIFLGFGGMRIFGTEKTAKRNVIKALSVNFSGGIDKTLEQNYDEQTILVYKNLFRETRDVIGIDTVDLITELIEYYEENEQIRSKYKIEEFVKASLEKLSIANIALNHLHEIHEAKKYIEN